jgi:hypothetical protein
MVAQGTSTPAPSLTAGTSGPPVHTRAHRFQSEATDSEAASAPASLWWPLPESGDRRGVKEKTELRLRNATEEQGEEGWPGRGTTV